MTKRLRLVQDICNLVGVTRKRPDRGDLSKRELYAVHAHLHLEKEIKRKGV